MMGQSTVRTDTPLFEVSARSIPLPSDNDLRICPRWWSKVEVQKTMGTRTYAQTTTKKGIQSVRNQTAFTFKNSSSWWTPPSRP